MPYPVLQARGTFAAVKFMFKVGPTLNGVRFGHGQAAGTVAEDQCEGGRFCLESSGK